MFEGQKDVLADFDNVPPPGGKDGGSGGGGGGGGGGWFGGFDWNEFGRNFWASIRGFMQTMGALLLFLSAILLLSFFDPAMKFVGSIVRGILRLDGPGKKLKPAAAAPELDQRSVDAVADDVIAKYGGDEEDVFGVQDGSGNDNAKH